MKPKISIALLGTPHVFREGAPITEAFLTRKAEALFYYLAVTQTTHRRDQLATLLWPEASEVRGRKNIRDVLPNLRKLVGDCLEITRQTVAFTGGATCWLDIEQFLAATTAVSPDPDQMADALTLYRGDLLEGFYIDDAPEYEMWLLAQQERFRQRYVTALHWMASHHLTQQNISAGLLTTQKLLEIEPWAEAVYRQRMLLYAYDQQPYAALQVYKQCHDVLAEAFGSTPSPMTESLYQRLQLETTSPELLTDHNLPRNLTPFFGRKKDINWIRSKLLDPAYPLLTVMGEGGIGKTRLALAVAKQVYYDFTDGVWFVPLDNAAPGATHVETEQALALALAQALEIRIQEGESVPKQVLAHLRSRHLLLVLDNMEHLLDGSPFLLTILQQARQVQLLVTSRARLMLQAERVYPLDELEVPDPALPAEQQATFASLQLLAERASRTGHPFALAGEKIGIARQICELVGGLPLAIELAAALLEPDKEQVVIEGIQQGATELALVMRDMPPRHRSLQAVFEYSWPLLTPREQAVLAQCAIFAGSFSIEAAVVVAEANPALLQRLCDHSFLRQLEDGLYGMHPLVREFCQRKLHQQGDEQEAVAQRHAAYYLHWLQTVFMPQNWDMPVRQIAPLFVDVKRAWHTAVEQNQFLLLADSSFALARFFDRLGSLKEIETMLANTLTHLRQQPSYDPKIEARLMSSQTYIQFHRHQFPDLIEAGQYILAHTDDAMARLRVIGNLSRALWSTGKLQEARHLLQEGLALCRAEPNPPSEMQVAYLRILQEMGITAMQAGEAELSRQHFEEALAMARAQNNRYATGSLLHSLGIYHQLRWHYYKSLQYENEALQAYKQISYQAGVTYAYNQLAYTLICLGQYEEAFQEYERTLTLARRMGMRLIEALALLGLCLGHLSQHELDAARDHAQKAWALYADVDDQVNIKGDILTALGKVHLAAGEWAEAQDSFTQSLYHWQKQERPEGRVEPLAGLAYVTLQLGDDAQARELADELLALLPDIFPYHEDIWQLTWAYLMLYETLQGLADPRATDVLAEAQEMVLTQANNIPEAGMRHHFLTQIPVHHRLGVLAKGA